MQNLLPRWSAMRPAILRVRIVDAKNMVVFDLVVEILEPMSVAGWSPDLLATVELRDFNLTGEPDDRRDLTAGRAAGDSRRQ